jgi:hypothetical protein
MHRDKIALQTNTTWPKKINIQVAIVGEGECAMVSMAGQWLALCTDYVYSVCVCVLSCMISYDCTRMFVR